MISNLPRTVAHRRQETLCRLIQHRSRREMSGREDAIDDALVKYPCIDELLGGIIKDRARSADRGGFVIDNLLTPLTAANTR